MSLPRFYCPDLTAEAGAHIRLPASVAHHALKVLRMRAGEEVVLFNGNGGVWHGVLEAGDSVAITASLPALPEPEVRITLIQSLPSGDKMDWVVQKAVELGVHRIQPVAATRSVVKLAGDRATKRVTHWQDVAISACEQCGRSAVPEVLPIVALNTLLASPDNSITTRFILAPDGSERLRGMAAPAGPIALLVGPEGGLTAEETQLAIRAGYAPLRFGPRILRTETAGLAVISAMMTLWGDV